MLRRAAVVAAVLLPGVLMWPSALDNFDIVKLTAVLIAVGLLLAATAGNALATGQLKVPKAPALWAAGAFIVAYAASTLASDQVAVSFFGVHPRYSGLLLYSCCTLLFVAVLRLFDAGAVRLVAYALIGSVVVVSTYGLVQLAGADPLPWGGAYGDVVFSTMGNPNFAAAYLAIGLPVLGWAALTRRPATLRWVAVALLPCAVLAIRGTRSSQGVIAGAAGLSVLALAWLLGRPARQRQLGLLALAVMVAGGALTAAAGLLGVGPVAALSRQVGTSLRGFYWRAAAAMLADNPLLGVGPDRYKANYRIYRPEEATLANALRQGNDAAHNVVLQLFSTGGALTGVAYLAVVGLTAWALVTGLRWLRGEERLLLGGLGGAWLAFQVQSLVSIDVPALAAVHWVLAGAVIVLGAPPALRTVELPWAPTGRSTTATRARRGVRGALVAGVLAVVALWVATVPLRADIAAGRANRLAASEDYSGALVALERATRLAPWEFTYWFERADVQLQSGDPSAALEALEVAAQRDPGDLKNPLAAARIAAENGRPELAAEQYQQALRIEPQHPELKVEAARVMASLGRTAEAQDLLEDALDVEPENVQAARLLASLAE